MIQIQLLNGKVLEFNEEFVTGLTIAQHISDSLAKNAIAMKINDILYDLNTEIFQNTQVTFITIEDDLGLNIIRHDTAHILAEAIKELYPKAKIAIGPVIKDGFYYDIECENKLSIDDFALIEQKMQEIINRNQPFIRKVISKEQALEMFHSINESYKVEIINELQDNISIYYHGKFFDLCRGPHALNTKHLKAFKLTKISGAYWRADSKNTMLQRIYGTAWRNQKELSNYLEILKEAEKRDHRKLGKDMNLFHFQDDAPGVVFWHDKGWQIFQILVNFIRKKQVDNNYIEVSTPEILAKSIWEISGHWEKFKENMFTAYTIEENKEYAVKPMSCPGAVQIYNHGLVSYKDLPIKMAEFGKVYRYEPSGALHGLMRVRGFTQDDAHIFCTEEQIQEESKKVCEFALSIYRECGFNDVKIKISTRPEKRIGSNEVWNKSEAALIQAVESMNLEYELNKGEGAFYGPKIEFTLTDALQREWQIGTLQVDFNLPVRFEAYYTCSDGTKKTPIMLHRAILGSIERFIGIILEHHAGVLPLWLSPVQVMILTVSEQFNDTANRVAAILKMHGIRVHIDNDNQTLNYKIRKHTLAKNPLIAIIGRNEELNNTVTVRKMNSDAQHTLSLDDLIAELKNTMK